MGSFLADESRVWYCWDSLFLLVNCQYEDQCIKVPRRSGAEHLICENFGRFRPLIAIDANTDLIERMDYGAEMAWSMEVSGGDE